MVPQSQARKPRNSSKINLVISLVFHGALVVVILFFAARSGMLGEKIKNTMTVRTEKEKVEPKKDQEKKVEPPKIDEPKLTVAPKMSTPTTAPAPSTTAPESVAPPPSEVPSFTIAGGQDVGDGDAVTVYKNLIQSVVRAKWKPPGELSEKNKDLVTDVEVSVDSTGRLGNARLTRTSGNRQWDDSVKQAIAETADTGARPPKGFPAKVTVRFDVAEEAENSL